MIISPFLRRPDYNGANIAHICERRSRAQEIADPIEECVAVMCGKKRARIESFCAGTLERVRTNQSAGCILGSIDSVAISATGRWYTLCQLSNPILHRVLNKNGARIDLPANFTPLTALGIGMPHTNVDTGAVRSGAHARPTNSNCERAQR
jgi:hypothetical protein